MDGRDPDLCRAEVTEDLAKQKIRISMGMVMAPDDTVGKIWMILSMPLMRRCIGSRKHITAGEVKKQTGGITDVYYMS